MHLYGFALLPSVAVQQEVIDFQQRHLDELNGPVLGLDTNLPHTSVLQHPYVQGVDYAPYLGLAESAIEATWTDCYYQPVGWLFAGVQSNPAMRRLQDRLLEATKRHIDTTQIDQRADLSKLTKLEAQNYQAYGYRYVGDAYRPHVTIGRASDDRGDLSPELKRDFQKTFSGKSFSYDRIAFYEAGEFGSLKRVVYVRALPAAGR